MYRLLFVDDEIEVTEYFYRTFTQESQLPLEVYTAGSAHEALECLDKIRIDVVLSDIKMPKMTGLQMYDVIKSKWPRCRVVFLSGVLEFDYVYKSMQNRNVRYLTKLEPTEKIIETVKEVLDEIEQSYKEQYTILKVQEQIKQAFPLLQNQYMYKILNNINEPDEFVQERFDELEIPLNFSEPVTMVGGIFDCIPENLSVSEIEKMVYSMKTISSEYFHENYNVICYISEQKFFIWLLQPKDRSDVAYKHSLEVLLNGQLEYIQGACRETLNLTISFAYSSEAVGFSGLREEFINIRKALGYKGGVTSEGIIVSTKDMSQSTILWEEPEVVNSCKQLVRINMLEGYLELGQEKEFQELFSSMVDCLINLKSRNYGPALEIYYSISTMFMKHINMWNLTEKLAFRIELFKLMRVDEHKSWEEAVKYLYSLAREIFEVRFANEVGITTDAVVLVQKYLLENLEKDLTLITLADRVKLNPSYLSRLFKDQTKINLYDYILEMRIAKAKELLKSTADKIQDISCKVGYESAQSFTRVFRKYTGKSPSEYRDGQ